MLSRITGQPNWDRNGYPYSRYQMDRRLVSHCSKHNIEYLITLLVKFNYTTTNRSYLAGNLCFFWLKKIIALTLLYKWIRERQFINHIGNISKLYEIIQIESIV